MNKILALVLTAILCLTGVAALAEGAASADAGVVKPIPVEIDLTNIPDGTYPVEFDPMDLANNVLSLTLYAVDHYADADVKGLAVGDEIYIDGETLKIESVETDEYGDVQINGGLVEDGYDLTMRDGDDFWTVAGLDDFPTWSELGEATLPLDDAVTLTDGYNGDDKPVKASGAEEVVKAIQSSEDVYFDEYSTQVTVQSGRIVEIVRVYVP